MMELTKKYKSGSALEILQEAILSGDIPAGIPITQNELAASLGTSRMPVREALIALEYRGLIERHTNQHINAAPLTDEDIRGVFSDLAVIECEAVKSLTDGELSALSECGTHEEFHALLCLRTGSAFRRRTLGTLTGVYLLFVLNNSEDRLRIDSVFANLREAVKNPADHEGITRAFAEYGRAFAAELIEIRRNRHAELEAG